MAHTQATDCLSLLVHGCGRGPPPLATGHSRSRSLEQFEVLGYTPMPLSDDMLSAFDTVRQHGIPGRCGISRTCATRQDRRARGTVGLLAWAPLRRDGRTLSRFRCLISTISVAAASRTWTMSSVTKSARQIDPNAQELFSETIYRLPDCLLCYDYSDDDHPAVTEPPSLTKKIVTFGCPW